MSTVYSRHKLFNSFIFSFPERTHKLLKFSMATRIVWEGFKRGICPYLFNFCISALVEMTWRRAMLSSLASWKAVVRIERSFFLFLSWRDFLVAIRISSLLVGRFREVNAWVPRLKFCILVVECAYRQARSVELLGRLLPRAPLVFGLVVRMGMDGFVPRSYRRYCSWNERSAWSSSQGDP